MKHKVPILAAALIALITGMAARHLAPSVSSTLSSPLPEFSFPDLSGRQRSLSEWQDSVLVINFWATWCPPCREEIPELIALQNQYSEKGLQIIGIAVEDRDPVAEFVDFIGIEYPVLVAGDQGIAMSRQLGNGVGAVPFTLVVDRQGQIVHRQPGQMSRDRLLSIVEPLLK
ncbi:MAG: TlpA family protein disulfide reductase [Gammaproteobacteria bacterium]